MLDIPPKRMPFGMPHALWLAGLLPVLAHGVGLGVGVADRVSTAQGAAIGIPVLANDLDFSAPAILTLAGAPASGGVVISGSPGAPGPGSTVLATYTPNPGYTGTDTFTYAVTDGVSSGSATVTVTVRADADLDGVGDAVDNCQQLANASQCDSDADGYGNRCDGDMNNNGSTNAQDTGLFRQQLGQPSVAPAFNKADLNCNGAVNAQDTGLFRQLLGQVPGPSAGRGAGNTYTVTGTVTGLTGSGLVLRNNGGDNLAVTTNGPFAFATGLAGGAAYNVTVLTQPTSPSQTCTVNNGSGTVNTGALAAATVTCATNTYAVGGVVSGRIAGTSLVIQNRNEALAMLGNGYYSFLNKLPSGAKYSVAVNAQPAGPDQVCGLTGTGAGTISASDIATINLTCAVSGKWYFSVNAVFNTISTYSISPSGSLTPVGVPVPTGTSPTAVITDPSGRFAYVTSKGANPATTPGIVSFYTINAATGALTLVNTVPTGKHPKSITLDGTATYAWVANYVDNSVSSYRINGDGSLTALGTVATATSPESVIILTDQSSGGVLTNRFAYVTASGGTVWLHNIAGTGALLLGADAAVSAGTSAPRLNFARQKITGLADRRAYVVNASANEIQFYLLNRLTGALVLTQSYDTGAGPGPLVFNAAGTVAYVPNSGDNTVSVYSVSLATGFLTPLGSPVATGPTPVFMTLDPGGTLAYVVNSGDGTVSNYSVNPTTGSLTPNGPPVVAADTTEIVVTPATGLATPYEGNKFVLAINNPAGGQTTKNIQVFSIDLDTGSLAAIGSPVPGIGQDPGAAYEFYALSPGGNFLFMSNSPGSSVSVYRLNPLSGELIEVPGSPFAAGNTTRAIAADPRGEFVYVGNSGTTAGIQGFRVNSVTGALTPLAGSPFLVGTPFLPNSAPIQIVLEPSGSFGYVTHYLQFPGDCGDDPVPHVSAFSIDRVSGALTAVGAPVNAAANSTYYYQGECAGGLLAMDQTVDPSGKFLYVANYAFQGPAGPVEIGAFRINPQTGALSPVPGAPFFLPTSRGATSVSVVPSGAFAYLGDGTTGQILPYTIDPATGALAAVAGTPVSTGSSVRQIVVDPTGSFVYTANRNYLGGFPSNAVSGFAIDLLSGNLTPVPGTPFPSGNPIGILVTP